MLGEVRAVRIGDVNANDSDDPLAVTMFEGASRDQRVRLYREDEGSKRMVFHGILSLDEATEEHVAELFGGGKFRVQLMVRNESGSEVVNKTIDFKLPGAYKAPSGSLPGIGVKPAVPAVSERPEFAFRPQSPQISPREAIEAAQVQQLLDITKISKEGRGIDWKEILPLVAPVLTALIDRLFAPRGNPELTEILSRIEQRLSNQPGPMQSQISDVMKSIESMIDVRDRIRGVGETEDDSGKGNMMSMASKVLELLTNAAGRQQSPGPGAPPQLRPVPGAPPAVPMPTLPLWQQMLRHYGPQLVDAARRGADPGMIADMAVTFMPSDMQGVALEFVKRPDAATVATQEIPALQEFATWNADFWRDFRAAVLGEDEDETPVS